MEWNGMQKTDPQLKAFVDKLDIVPPLNPREAFFGGRTNAIKLHHKVDENENEKTEYRDIISLYPCANLECDYPICHPKFIDQPRTTDISRYYGLIKCKILPPYELYHPVLPWRYESKLLFPLCRTCAQQNKQSQKEATSAPILPRKDASQVPGQPWNYKKPLKRGTSSCTFTKFGTSTFKGTFFPLHKNFYETRTTDFWLAFRM